MSDATHATLDGWGAPVASTHDAAGGRDPLRPRRRRRALRAAVHHVAGPERPAVPAPVAAADRRDRGDVTEPAGRTWWRRPGAATGRRSKSSCALHHDRHLRPGPPHHRQRRRRRRRHPGGADRHRPRPPPLRRPLVVRARGPTASRPTPAWTSCAVVAGGRCVDLPDERADRADPAAAARHHDRRSAAPRRRPRRAARGLPRRRRAARRLRPRLRRDRRGAGVPARHRALPHRPGAGPAGRPPRREPPDRPCTSKSRTMSDLSPRDPTADELASAYLDGEATPASGPPSRPTPRLVARVEELRAVRRALAAPVAAPPGRRRGRRHRRRAGGGRHRRAGAATRRRRRPDRSSRPARGSGAGPCSWPCSARRPPSSPSWRWRRCGRRTRPSTAAGGAASTLATEQAASASAGADIAAATTAGAATTTPAARVARDDGRGAGGGIDGDRSQAAGAGGGGAALPALGPIDDAADLRTALRRWCRRGLAAADRVGRRRRLRRGRCRTGGDRRVAGHARLRVRRPLAATADRRQPVDVRHAGRPSRSRDTRPPVGCAHVRPHAVARLGGAHRRQHRACRHHRPGPHDAAPAGGRPGDRLRPPGRHRRRRRRGAAVDPDRPGARDPHRSGVGGRPDPRRPLRHRRLRAPAPARGQRCRRWRWREQPPPRADRRVRARPA